MAVHTQAQVLSIQRMLQALGYDPATLDGVIGPRTRAAIRAFQRDHGLRIDGVAGPVTCARLQLLVEPRWLAIARGHLGLAERDGPASNALLLQWATTGHRLWRSVQAVRSRVLGQAGLACVSVRVPHSSRSADRWLALYGALLDIVQGRRSWFGLRPRQEPEWYALGRDWQELFGRTTIGLFHAPAWTERSANLDHEAYAAADAFMAVQPSLGARVRILYHHTRRG